jgi:predicted DCC family thiol-disulfide oxidoreductase YuxK
MELQNSIVLFDGVCNLCNSSVQFIIRNDTKNKFKFAPLQSMFAKRIINGKVLDKKILDSIVLIEKNNVYTESGAALRIARHLRFPISLLFVFYFVPKFIRDAVYKLIARNRYKWFGKRESCMLPNPELKSKFLSENDKII